MGCLGGVLGSVHAARNAVSPLPVSGAPLRAATSVAWPGAGEGVLMAFEMTPVGTQSAHARDWTAREHLAAMAMQGLCADSNSAFDNHRQMAVWAFEAADALLAEGERDGADS